MGPLNDWESFLFLALGEVAELILFFLYVALEGGSFVSLERENISTGCYLRENLEVKALSPGGMIWKRKGLIQLMPTINRPPFYTLFFSSVCLGALSSQSLKELCSLPINYGHFLCGLWQPQAIR